MLDVCDPDLINFLEDLQKRQPTVKSILFIYVFGTSQHMTCCNFKFFAEIQLVKEKSAQESQQRRQPLKRRYIFVDKY